MVYNVVYYMQGGFEMKRTKLIPLFTLLTIVGLTLLALPSSQMVVTPELPATLDTGNTAWMLISMALVFFMIPGLALFYGGMARRSSVLSTMMKSYLAIGFGGMVWITVGYTIAFGTQGSDFFGSFNNLFLHNIGILELNSNHVPVFVWILFQGMFAVIAVALISGAIIERTKFVSYVIFIILWLLLIYAPTAHWAWDSTGFLFKMGVLDFAGGTVIHVSAGISAVVAALMIGPRVERIDQPHNIPFVLLGTGILWFGWFGFNAGSAGGANPLAALASINTFSASAAAFSTWVLLDLIFHKKSSALGASIGAVVGLVAITPAAGFVSPTASILFGVCGVIASFFLLQFKERFPFDDALDVFACHGVGGIVGCLLTGVFAFTTHSGKDTITQLGIQARSILIISLYAAVVTFLILFLLKKTLGLRLEHNQKTEFNHIDEMMLGEKGYGLLPDEK